MPVRSSVSFKEASWGESSALMYINLFELTSFIGRRNCSVMLNFHLKLNLHLILTHGADIGFNAITSLPREPNAKHGKFFSLYRPTVFVLLVMHFDKLCGL